MKRGYYERPDRGILNHTETDQTGSNQFRFYAFVFEYSQHKLVGVYQNHVGVYQNHVGIYQSKSVSGRVRNYIQ